MVCKFPRCSLSMFILLVICGLVAATPTAEARADIAPSRQALFGDSTAILRKSAPLLELYEDECQSWLEYIDRFRDYQADNSYDVLFYYIAVDIAVDTEYLTGRVLCRIAASEDNLSSIKLNLHDSYTVDSITGNAGSFALALDTLSVTLDRTYASGEIAEFTVYYQGVPETVGGVKGLRYETHGVGEPIIASLSTPYLAHYWWPCKDGPGDKPDSVYVDITIPDRTVAGNQLIAVSNGVLENVIAAAGKNTYQWRHHYPIVTYYVMAAISNYAHFQDYYTGAYGEAFPLDYYSFAENLAESQAGVADFPEVIEVFSDLFGPYPFREEKYGMTQLGFYGGIENQTNTIQGEFSPEWFMTTVHEFSHQWFGDLITCADWHHGWLNEGFATYAEALWREHREGVWGYQDEMAMNEFYSGGTLYLQNISDPLNVFISIIYSKGAWAVHMLRGVLGDEVFFDCLAQYTHSPQFMYGHATTEDLQDLCETVSGVDLDYFFDQWIYDEYYPEYHWGFAQNPATYQASLTVFQRQNLLGRRAVFTMPLQVLLHSATDGDTIITVWNEQHEQTFDLSLDFLVDQVFFDPNHWILCTRTNDYRPDLERQAIVYNDLAGNGDGHPDPGEGPVEMVLEVINHGLDAYALTASARSLDLEVVFNQATSAFGDVLQGEQGTNAADPLVFTAAAGIDPTLVHVELILAANNGLYADTTILRLNIGPAQVIVVDDDLSAPLHYENYYLEVLDSLHVPLATWCKDELATPPADTLAGYPLVLWFTGNARSEVLSIEDVANLRGFLDGGGRLLLTGQDIAEDLSNDADSTFLLDYLHTRFIPGIPLLLAQGVPGDPISDGHLVPLGGPGGAANQNSPDYLTPTDEAAQTIYTYYYSTNAAGVRVETPNYRAVLLGFGCEAIADGLTGYTKRAEVMGNILEWLTWVEPVYIPGDVENDGDVDPVDVTYIVHYVYRQSVPPVILNSADVNADCRVNPLDVTLLVKFVYKSLGELQPGCVE